MTADAAKKATPGRTPAAQKRAQRKAARERFMRARKAEIRYERQLRAIAKQVGVIVKGFAPNGRVRAPAELSAALNRYAEVIKPWARSVSERMISDVDQRDAKAWSQLGQELGYHLRGEIEGAQIGNPMRARLAEQVSLITSLPIQAAERVHKLTVEAMMDGRRADEIAKEILRSGKVTESRAQLIARTEVARTAATLVQTRSEFVGSEGYIWRTVRDSDVRQEHKDLEGTYILWTKPPIAGSNGERAHAGMIYNCRCWAEPVLPDFSK